jgi:hypothetical protein
MRIFDIINTTTMKEIIFIPLIYLMPVVGLWFFSGFLIYKTII